MAAAKNNTYTMNRKINPQYTDKQIADIIENLLVYANSDSGLYLATFAYEKYKQPSSWLYNLAEHHKDLKEALSVARELIAGKVARHSWLGDRNSTFGEKILPMYSKEYKDLLEWKANLAKQTSETIKTTFSEMKNAIQDGSLLDMLKQVEESK